MQRPQLRQRRRLSSAAASESEAETSSFRAVRAAPAPRRVKARPVFGMDGNQFRGHVEFQEKPKQLWFLALMVVPLAYIGFTRKDQSSEVDIRSDLVAAMAAFAFCFLVYCAVAIRDGLLIRPHPLFWRVAHGASVLYVMVLAALLVQNVDTARAFLRILYEDINERHDADWDMQACEVNWPNVYRQLTSIWFLSHLLGWFGKMCMLRSWKMCMFQSVAFELVEVSLQYIIPEFRECWWDSVFMDLILANTGGMFLGWLVLKFLGMTVKSGAAGATPANYPSAADFVPPPAKSLTKGAQDDSDDEDDSPSDGDHTDDDNPDTHEVVRAHQASNSMRTKSLTSSVRSQTQRPLSPRNKPVSLGTRVKRALRLAMTRFLPYPARFESSYDWNPFADPWRYLGNITLVLVVLLVEANFFFLLYSLYIPPLNPLPKYRITLLCFLAFPAVAEFYEYLGTPASAPGRRIGPNTFVICALSLLEVLMSFKYGARVFTINVPPIGVWLPWILSISSLVVWSVVYFGRGYHKERRAGRFAAGRGFGQYRLMDWLFLACFLPLASLTRYWVWP